MQWFFRRPQPSAPTYAFVWKDRQPMTMPGRGTVMVVAEKITGTATLAKSTQGYWIITAIEIDAEDDTHEPPVPVRCPLAQTNPLYARIELYLLTACQREIDAVWDGREAA